MNNNTTTTKTTTSEFFEEFEGKRCNIDIEIGITAFFSLNQCFLTFEGNDDFIDDDGNDYDVYDELTILQCGSESTIQLGNLDKISVRGDKTKFGFDNGVTLTIKID